MPHLPKIVDEWDNVIKMLIDGYPLGISTGLCIIIKKYCELEHLNPSCISYLRMLLDETAKNNDGYVVPDMYYWQMTGKYSYQCRMDIIREIKEVMEKEISNG